jgi:pimeloyl-ACP methyl ester carboxylesterase
MNLTANKFCLENARELALYARAAYDESPTLQDKFTDTQVLIQDCGDCVVVAFRGTSNLRDAITDGEAWFIQTEFGKVHYGIWRAWSAISRPLYEALRPYNFKPVISLGHSLGGGLAQLGARALRQMLVNIHSVYCYGAPRIGNRAFQSSYNALPVPGSPFDTLGDATFTLIHDCDLVPRVPGWLSGYRRPGHDEFISELSPDIWEDPSVPLRIGSDVFAIGKSWAMKMGLKSFTQIITDHRIDNYIAALNAVSPLPSPLAPESVEVKA